MCLDCQEPNELMIYKEKLYSITSMSQGVNFIRLDSQSIAKIGQVYSWLFNQEQPHKKKKGERILEQRLAPKSLDRSQEKLVKILEHLKINNFPSANKQRTTQERVCKILKHFMNRDEEMAKRQIQQLQGEINTTMHVFLNCYFYQTIPLDNKDNLPLGRYFDAVTNPHTEIAQIQEKYNNLPYSQPDFFYPLHCQIVRLKDQFKKFQKFKAGRNQKDIKVSAKTENMLDETNQKNRAIQERDQSRLKMTKVISILSDITEIQENMIQQALQGTLGRKIQGSPQEFRLVLRKIYLNVVNLSKKMGQRQDSASSRTLISEIRNQNNMLQRDTQYLKQQSQQQQRKIKELENKLGSNSNQDYDKLLFQKTVLTSKINQLNEALIEKQETHKTEHEQLQKNLELARYSLRILSGEKEQQKLEYTKLDQRNARLNKEIEQLRNQIIALKHQNVMFAQQTSHLPDIPAEEIINKLRTNQKIQKRNHDKLAELFEIQRAQRLEADLEASKIKKSYQESQTIIRTLKEEKQKYEVMLQRKQGNMKIPDMDDESLYEAEDVQR